MKMAQGDRRESVFSEHLLTWYGKQRRVLPWRDESDPYRIWISEVMLQQTQVGTVIPYYHRWLQRFPTLESVAQSSLDDVLKVWEGLGYYSRCRNFHRACQIVIKDYGGRVPEDWTPFRQLPGVGDYTAAAVLSFAFGKPHPVIDGNVSRVMARLLAFSRPVTRGRRIFGERLNGWMDRKRPGEFNQAMMELGSLVCRRNQPHCFECPVADFCEGYKQGVPEEFPVRLETKRRPHKILVVGVIWRGDKFLIQKRPEEGLLGGLWEFPGGKVNKGESLEEALLREIKEETLLHVSVKKPIGTVEHAYSHFSITLHGYHCSVLDGSHLKESETERRWVEPEDLPDFAFPKANHKLFHLLRSDGWVH